MFTRSPGWLHVAALALVSVCDASAGTRRAVVVGINTYLPQPGTIAASSTRDAWSDLDGAVNDAQDIAALLEDRFGFERADIEVLLDRNATRSAILAALQRVLIDEARPGDVGVFYYAGHGSQVANSRSTELDRRDETLVPADSYSGAPDIRDKELARLLRAAARKGVQLTVILDSCHSGSAERGLPPRSKARFLQPPGGDAADPPDKEPEPAALGVLTIAAAQDYQRANETIDENDRAHGLFTLSLVRSLRTAASNESADRTFLRIKALMQGQGSFQEPVLAASAERRGRAMFGAAAGQPGNVVAVLNVDPATGLTLQGGRVSGLRPGAELVRDTAAGTPSGAAGNTPLRVRITSLIGVNRSAATVVDGRATDLRPGDLLRVDRWVAGDGGPLRATIPPAAPSGDLQEFLEGSIGALRMKARADWVADPTLGGPVHVLAWDGRQWTLTSPGGRTSPLGRRPAIDALERALERGERVPRVFLQVPPTVDVASALRRSSAGQDLVRFVESGASQYVLAGRDRNRTIEYAWVRPETRSEPANADATLPSRTGWYLPATGASDPESLEGSLVGLARIHGWLTIDVPPDDGTFPYTLALRPAGGGALVTQGPLEKGGEYTLALGAARLPETLTMRYVYVFVIDRDGRSTLLFPSLTQGNVENRFPPLVDGRPTRAREIDLPSKPFAVTDPLGVDTYMVLTTVQPLADPSVLAWDPVRQDGVGSRGTSPLDRLLANPARRGGSDAVPAAWSLERVPLLSVEKSKGHP